MIDRRRWRCIGLRPRMRLDHPGARQRRCLFMLLARQFLGTLFRLDLGGAGIPFLGRHGAADEMQVRFMNPRLVHALLRPELLVASRREAHAARSRQRRVIGRDHDPCAGTDLPRVGIAVGVHQRVGRNAITAGDDLRRLALRHDDRHAAFRRPARTARAHGVRGRIAAVPAMRSDMRARGGRRRIGIGGRGAARIIGRRRERPRLDGLRRRIRLRIGNAARRRAIDIATERIGERISQTLGIGTSGKQAGAATDHEKTKNKTGAQCRRETGHDATR